MVQLPHLGETQSACKERGKGRAEDASSGVTTSTPAEIQLLRSNKNTRLDI